MSGSALCQSCALCCDGSLFATVPLEKKVLPGLPAEAQLREDGSSFLQLPCGALRGSRCGAYEARPLTCRTYECLLVQALKEGELNLREAVEVVQEAKTLIREVATVAPEGDGAVMQRARRAVKSGATEALQTRWATAERFLQRHFLGRR